MLKRSAKDFAIFGGNPAFSQPLHVGRPSLGDRGSFMRRMDDLLDRRWLSNFGPFVREFEDRIAALTGVRNCIATCNATVGLEAVIGALELSGTVIVPSFTFIATAHALQRQGLAPVFCEVDPKSHNLDPAKVEALIRPDTTAILGVHLWGRPSDVSALQDIADRNGLKLLFDAAQAFGSTHGGRPLGRSGVAEVFSFHATKAITSFEGGAITTDNDELAARLRLAINFGIADYDTVVSLGTNGKMSEPCAAMGLTSIESMKEIFAHNRANHEHYGERLKGMPGLMLQTYDPQERASHQYVVVEVDEGAFGMSRDDLQRVLVAEGILARRYFYPGCHRSEPYRSLPAYNGVSLPITEQLCERVLCLPTGTSVGAGEIEQVCEIIRLASELSPQLLARLAA